MVARRLFAPLFALLALALVAAPASAGVRKGDRAPDFVQVTDARGKRVSLDEYKDRVVVLTFGASWCPPCKKELPALEKLARRYAKKDKKVVFIAVNIDTKKAKGRRFVKELGLKRVHTVFDPKKSTVESYDPPKMPSVFIIKRGIVKHVHAGYSSGDAKKLDKRIEREL